MIRKRFELPKDSDEAARILWRSANRNDGLITMKRLNTTLATFYAAGYRRFDRLNPVDGSVIARFTDSEDGNNTHPLGEGQLLFNLQQIMGYLQGMDMRPVATSSIKTLDAIRQQGAANAILGSITRPQGLQGVYTQLDYNYAYLGMGALHVGVEDHVAMGLFTDMETVHPLELMPFPYLRPGYTQAQGIQRRRLITRESLVDHYGKRVVKRLEDNGKAAYYDLQSGDPIEFMDLPSSFPQLGNYGQVYSFSAAGGGPKEATTRAFEVIETWMYGPMGTVDRMIVTCGDVAIEDTSFEGTETYCPVVYRRCYENGTFWGAGHFDMAFGGVRRAELLRKAVFRSLINQTEWPIVLLPQGQVNERTAMGTIGGGALRYLKYGTDPAVDRPLSPMMIQPVTASPANVQIAQFLEATARETNPVPDLSQEKGRIDSAQALQYLDQETKRPINVVLRGKREMLGDAARVACQAAVRSLQEAPRFIPVPNLTLDLVGVSIDQESMEIGFNENPLPNIGRLTFTVMEGHPNQGVAAKMEGLSLVQGAFQSFSEFELYCVKNDIPLAKDLGAIRQAYNNAVLNILLLFNDGQTPQEVAINTVSIRADIELAVLAPFLASKEFMRASTGVQEALLSYQQLLQNQLQILLPPTPATTSGVGA